MPTNSVSDKLTRLLQLFSKEVLESHFGLESKKKVPAIDQIVSGTDQSTIEQFALEKCQRTKQHNYLFSHDVNNLSSLPAELLDAPRRIFQGEQGNRIVYFYLVDLDYLVYVEDPLEVLTIKFMWPVRIIFYGNVVRVSFTTMEKNMGAYLEPGRHLIRAQRNLDENTLLAQFKSALPLDANLAALDLHKGIKSMWHSGLIDAPYVQWKKPRSISRDDMDESCLVRRDDPTLYAAVRKQPLFKTGFKFMDQPELFVSHFVIDPAQGFLVFPVFPRGSQSIEHVIEEILRLN